MYSPRPIKSKLASLLFIVHNRHLVSCCLPSPLLLLLFLSFLPSRSCCCLCPPCFPLSSPSLASLPPPPLQLPSAPPNPSLTASSRSLSLRRQNTSLGARTERPISIGSRMPMTEYDSELCFFLSLAHESVLSIRFRTANTEASSRVREERRRGGRLLQRL
jgi:hypothetical protein